MRYAAVQKKMGYDAEHYKGVADRKALSKLSQYKKEEEILRRTKEIEHACNKLMLNHEL